MRENERIWTGAGPWVPSAPLDPPLFMFENLSFASQMSHICPSAKYNETFQFSDHLVPESHLNSRRYKGISYSVGDPGLSRPGGGGRESSRGGVIHAKWITSFSWNSKKVWTPRGGRASLTPPLGIRQCYDIYLINISHLHWRIAMNTNKSE